MPLLILLYTALFSIYQGSINTLFLTEIGIVCKYIQYIQKRLTHSSMYEMQNFVHAHTSIILGSVVIITKNILR